MTSTDWVRILLNDPADEVTPVVFADQLDEWGFHSLAGQLRSNPNRGLTTATAATAATASAATAATASAATAATATAATATATAATATATAATATAAAVSKER